jgi:hypothetical protein
VPELLGIRNGVARLDLVVGDVQRHHGDRDRPSPSSNTQPGSPLISTSRIPTTPSFQAPRVAASGPRGKKVANLLSGRRGRVIGTPLGIVLFAVGLGLLLTPKERRR